MSLFHFLIQVPQKRQANQMTKVKNLYYKSYNKINFWRVISIIKQDLNLKFGMQTLITNKRLKLLFAQAKINKRIMCVFTFGTSIQLPMLFFNLSEADSFRFAQTAFVVREFIANGIDFRMPIPIFGSNSFAPFEFPLFQIAASFVADQLNVDPLIASRLSALIFFQATGILLYLLSKKWFSSDVAIIGAILFQFLPFGLRYAHSPLIEFTAIFFILLAVFAFDRLSELNIKQASLISSSLATISLSLGFLVKVTTGVALLPLLAIPLISIIRSDGEAIWKLVRLLHLVGSSLIALIAVFLWNRHADAVKENNPLTAYLVSSTPQMKKWNFGTLQDRIDPKTWIDIFFQYLGPITSGILTLLVLALFSFKSFSVSKVIPLLATVIVGPLIFTNLYRSHQYYVAAIYPTLVILMGLGVCSISKLFSSNKSKLKYLLTSILIATSFSTNLGVNYSADIFNHSDIPKLAVEIRDNVPKGGYVLYLGCDWNPEIPYYSQRKSLMVPEWNIKPLTQDLNLIDHVAFCDFVPLVREDQFEKYFSNKLKPVRISENVFWIRD